jgi:hexosaminidase
MAHNLRLAILCAVAGSALSFPRAASAQQSMLNLMPMPANVQQSAGSLRVDSNFTVALTGQVEPRLERAAERFLHQLARQTALPLKPQPKKAAQATLIVHTDHASKEIQEVGEDESYTLEVSSSGAKLTAATPLSTMHGLQTFLQLVDVSADGFAAPAVTIQDKPRFPWRGLMIDSARHFIPLDVVRRNLDGMDAVKMNVFHWHLSENQGFRVESKKYPKLHEMGSDGLYYTQEEIRDMIAYARDRGIRVVPEFDVPGHSTAWFVGHPELASGPGPYEIERRWGVFDPAFDPTNEKTYKFLDAFIGEMAKLFPDQFFHVGGDEVNGKQWDANKQIQEFMRAHGIKNNQALQAYFNKRLQAIVEKHGKSMIGWDEILDPSLPKDITIHSWRGAAGLAAAAKQGYRAILSNGYYLDLGWPASRHYANDPLSGEAANLSPEEQNRILGGESCMWSEYVNPENIDSRIWPRNAAIAERLWSPREVTDVAAMYTRLDFVSDRLEWLGLTHKSYFPKMLHRVAGAATATEFAALRTLADVVEPVKDYTREQTAPEKPTSATPMNRLVDAAQLESVTARRFATLVDSYLASSYCSNKEIEEQLRAQLNIWSQNDLQLQPLISRSFLLKGTAATSKYLSLLSQAGLTALDYHKEGLYAPESIQKKQLEVMDFLEAQSKAAQLIVVPAAAVRKLIQQLETPGYCGPGSM